MKMAQVVKPLPSDSTRYVVSYYEDNKLQYDIISEVDVIDENEYEIIKNRVNTINRILKS